MVGRWIPGCAWALAACTLHGAATAQAVMLPALADALPSRALQRVALPSGEPRLSREQLREVQRLLQARGHCELQVDGADGPRTAAAVRAEEQRLGWKPTGRAGERLLDALRSDKPDAVGCTAGVPPAAGAVFTTSQPAPGQALPPVAPAAPPVVTATPPVPPRVPGSAASAGSVRPPHEVSPASAPASGAGATTSPVMPPVAPPTNRASAPS